MLNLMDRGNLDMSTGTTTSPNLPTAPAEYSSRYQDQLNNVLRLYFAQLDNPGPSVMSTQKTNARIISALNFSTLLNGVQTISLPTQADLANLRVGDLYYDTSAGNALKVKV
jgi:hypothetical protein